MALRFVLPIITGILIGLSSPLSGPAKAKFPELKGPYFGQKAPGRIAEMFGPGIISTEHHDDGPPAFAPGGKECFFRVNGQDNGQPRPGVIFWTKEENGRWTEPRPASFTGTDNIGLVRMAKNGVRLFFSSRRPIEGIVPPDSARLWVVDRSDSGWSEPRPVPLPLEGRRLEGFDVAGDGTLFVALGRGVEARIFLMKLVSGKYQTPQPIDLGLASGQGAIVPAVSPDGRCLVFNVIGKGAGELYLAASFLSADGTWSPGRKLGDEVNAAGPRFPGFSPDGKILFFETRMKENNPSKTWRTDLFRGSQEGGVDVFWIAASVLDGLRLSP